MARWPARTALRWQHWEPLLYRTYYRLPLLSFRRKRLIVLALHRYLGFLTRNTESYRHFVRGGGAIGEPALPVPDDCRDYRSWLHRHGRTLRLEQAVRALPERPLISLIVPATDGDPRWLGRVVADLRSQPYAEWELLSATPVPGSADARVRQPEPGALASRARGAYVALLEPGARLADDALYRIARALRERPDTELLFGDEDRIDARGRRGEPYFKSGWDPDMALDHDLIGGFAVYRCERLARVDEAGGNHALFLQLSENLPAARIVHLPRILHHRDAATPRAAPLEPVREALRRRGVMARVEPSPLLDDAVRVCFPLPQPAPRVSLIIPTRNGLDLLRGCIESLIERTAYPDYELIVVDNGSDDPATLDYLAALTERRTGVPIRVLRDPRPFNYSQLNNNAVAVATGELIGLLNNDLEVTDGDWLEEMTGLALRPEVGAVGARLLYPDGRLQHAGVMVGFGGVAGHVPRGQPPDESFQRGWTRRLRSLTAVTAACLVMRRALYETVGGLDEVDLPVAFNDVDLCLRLRRAGYRVLCTPFATLYHHESASRGSEDESPEKAARAAREIEVLRARWHTDDFEDPAFGPNLSRYHEAGVYAFPPRYRPDGGNEPQ